MNIVKFCILFLTTGLLFSISLSLYTMGICTPLDLYFMEIKNRIPTVIQKAKQCSNLTKEAVIFDSNLTSGSAVALTIEAFLFYAAPPVWPLTCLVMALTSTGFSVAAIDTFKRNGLHRATHNNNQKKIKHYLNDFNFDINRKNEKGETSLMHAARLGQLETVQLLLEHGADPNLQIEYNTHSQWQTATDGNTALHFAFQIPQPTVRAEKVRLLKSYNADPSIPNRYGRTALQLARQIDQQSNITPTLFSILTDR